MQFKNKLGQRESTFLIENLLFKRKFQSIRNFVLETSTCISKCFIGFFALFRGGCSHEFSKSAVQHTVSEWSH